MFLKRNALKYFGAARNYSAHGLTVKLTFNCTTDHQLQYFLVRKKYGNFKKTNKCLKTVML